VAAAAALPAATEPSIALRLKREERSVEE